MKLSKLKIAIVSAIHLVLVYVSMFYFLGSAMAGFEGEEITLFQELTENIAVSLFNILRFPLGYVTWLFPTSFGILLFILNSILWGFVIVYIFTKFKNNSQAQGRRHVK